MGERRRGTPNQRRKLRDRHHLPLPLAWRPAPLEGGVSRTTLPRGQSRPRRPLVARVRPYIGRVLTNLTRLQGRCHVASVLRCKPPTRFVQKGERAMHRTGVFVYGVFSYACLLATFLYAT